MKYKFPPQLIKIFFDYLTNRRYAVRVSNTLSTEYPILSGVPQGNLVGPKLFNVYVNDIPKHDRVHLAMFADDTAYICSYKNSYTILKYMSEQMTELNWWLQKWKIKVNTSKCAAVHYPAVFSRRLSHNSNISLNNELIPWQANYKYLGLYLDSKLDWNSHFDHIEKKVRISRALLRSFLARNSRLSIETKLLLYKAFIRPVMTYGSSVWGYTSVTNLRRLQVMQNVILRQIRNTTRYLRTDVLHIDLEIRPLSLFIQKLALKFFRDLPKVSNDCVRNIANYDYNSQVSRRLRRPKRVLDPIDNTFLRPVKRERRS